MENEVLDALDDIGYTGALNSDTISEILKAGVANITYTSVIAHLVKELCDFYDIQESVGPVAVENNAEASKCFLMELSGFLREFGCPYEELINGPVEKRLQDSESCLLLLDYLLGEFQAAQLYYTDIPTESVRNQQASTELSCSECLKHMLICLSFPKPPANITPVQLFTKINSRVNEIITHHPGALGSPLLKARLTPNQWIKVSEYNNKLAQEYNLRREMLCKRLDVTIQSFLWSDRAKIHQDSALRLYQPLRQRLKDPSAVTVSDLLSARDSLLCIRKTNSNRKGLETRVNKVLMGNVPDRGGRTGTMQAPPPEMPAFAKRQSGPGPMGSRQQSGGKYGGGRGRVQGGWSDRNSGSKAGGKTSKLHH